MACACVLVCVYWVHEVRQHLPNENEEMTMTYTTNLTVNEIHVLGAIATDEMNSLNGLRPNSEHDVQTWIDLQSWSPEGWKVEQTVGVISSLIKKDLIVIEGETVRFTKKGFDTYVEYFPA